MKRFARCALTALALAVTPAAYGAPGDGIAKSCIAATEARARQHKQLPPAYVHRKALCACLQRRVQADDQIADVQKTNLARYFALEAADRKKALDFLLTLPKPVMQRMQVHGPACAKAIVPGKPKN